MNSTEFLVFSGGASKGYAHIGALTCINRIFEAHGLNMIDQIKGYGGSSIGAFVALVCCICVESVGEITDFLSSVNLKNSMVLDVNFATTKAILKNAGFIEMVNSLLAVRFGKIAVDKKLVTLDFLYRKTGKHLKIIVSNMTTGKPEVWDWRTQGAMQVSTAIMASCALPGVFEPIILNGTDVYMDGGTFMNFPISVFGPAAEKVLGINFVSKQTFDPAFVAKSSPIEYISQVQTSIIRYYTADTLAAARNVISVDLTFMGASPLDLLSPDPRCIELLKRAGQVAALIYFLAHDHLYSVAFLLVLALVISMLARARRAVTSILLHQY